MHSINVLVTGATGFIGQHLVRRLLINGYCVRGFARSKNDIFRAPNLSWTIGDIRDRESLINASHNTTIVYHVAGSVRNSCSQTEMWETNVEGTQNVVEACIKNKVKRIVYLSSIAAYKPPLPPIVKEDTPLGGHDDYGRSKTEAEAILFATVSNSSLEHVILRPCQVYGPGDRSGFTNLLTRLLQSPILPVVVDGKNSFSIIHVSDVVEAITSAGNHSNLRYKVYNISSSKTISIQDFAKYCRTSTAERQYKLRIPRWCFRAALSLCWFFKSLKERNVTPLIRSYSKKELHGSVFLGGPLYDISRARKDIGYRPHHGYTTCFK